MTEIRERAERLAQKLADSNVKPDEVPALVDKAFDVVEVCVDVVEDGRVTFRELGRVTNKISAFMDALRDARAD